MKYAFTVPEIREIAGILQKYVVFASGHNITWTNTNKLLDLESEFYCLNAIGLKTETADLSGCNLIAAFNKNGKLYIAVAVGCINDKERKALPYGIFGGKLRFGNTGNTYFRNNIYST